MQLANLWIFFYNSGAAPPVTVVPLTTHIVIDLPELTLSGSITLGS